MSSIAQKWFFVNSFFVILAIFRYLEKTLKRLSFTGVELFNISYCQKWLFYLKWLKYIKQ